MSDGKLDGLCSVIGQWQDNRHFIILFQSVSVRKKSFCFLVSLNSPTLGAKKKKIPLLAPVKHFRGKEPRHPDPGLVVIPLVVLLGERWGFHRSQGTKFSSWIHNILIFELKVSCYVQVLTLLRWKKSCTQSDLRFDHGQLQPWQCLIQEKELDWSEGSQSIFKLPFFRNFLL